jgi:FixJ family two-component response regulator
MERFVLLVDDDENILCGLARVLRQQPYHLYTARTGEEAVEVLKSRSVDVLVADEQMPGMSGSDLLAWTADNYPDVRRIMLTGRATTQMAVRAINEGLVYHFLTKPCNEVQLAITIRKAIEHRGLVQKNRTLFNQTRRQLDDLRRFHQNLGVLTDVLAKDLRNPLQTILESFRTLQHQYHDLIDPKAVTLLDLAFEATSEAQQLASDLLEHFREQGPSAVLEPLNTDDENTTAADELLAELLEEQPIG